LSDSNPTTRRSFFRRRAAATALSTKGAWAAVAVPSDAELIRLCAEFDGLERRLQMMDAEHPSTVEGDMRFDAAYEVIRDEQEQLLARICALPAITVEGTLAKATTLVYYTSNMLTQGDTGWGVQLTISMRRDLTNAGRLPAYSRTHLAAQAGAPRPSCHARGLDRPQPAFWTLRSTVHGQPKKAAIDVTAN